jgi:hypothetical protein
MLVFNFPRDSSPKVTFKKTNSKNSPLLRERGLALLNEKSDLTRARKKSYLLRSP